MKARVWSAFILLAIIWGASFLFIKIALDDLQPFTLVTLRLGLATLFLWAILLISGRKLPSDRRTTVLLLLIGILGVTAPFSLITFGETTIDSGVAGVLNATNPLFAIIIGHFILAEERITLLRAAGLLLGFAGVVVIFSRDLQSGPIFGAGWPVIRGQLAVVLAAFCYAWTVVLVRRFVHGVEPLVVSTLQMSSAFVFTLLAALIVERPISVTMQGQTIFALVWLGVLGTCIAYILFYYVLQHWGAVRVTLVTYLIPVFAVILGAVVLDEQIGWRLILGFILIVGGIFLVNRVRIQPKPAERSSESSAH